MSEKIRWQRVNEEPFEYAIQQGPHGDEFVKLLDGTCLRRAASPAQEPVTTEPVAWQWWTKIGLINMTSSRSEAESWRTKDADVRPLYAIPAPPQPGREDSELEELVAQAIWEECCPGMKWGQIDHLIYCRMAGAAIARMRALTGEPK